jgi:hypothetical protein
MMFSNCTALREITFPSSVKVIGYYAFAGCTELVHAALPQHLETIQTGAFSNCKQLTLNSLPASLNAIEEYAFENCTSIREVALPEGLLVIREGVFQGCSALQQVAIPSTVVSTISRAFFDCPQLRDVYCHPTVPPVHYKDPYVSLWDDFAFNDFITPTLHVPAGSREAYASAYMWQEFTNIVEMEPASVLRPSATAVTSGAQHYTISGSPASPSSKGIHVVRYPDGTTRKVLTR